MLDWGNGDAEVTVFRHWLSAMAGGYASHGEVIKSNGNNKDLFWSYGGVLVGESGPRLKYMRQILESCNYQEMNRDYVNTDGHHYYSLHKKTEEYLIFCRYSLHGKKLWFGATDGSEIEYDAVIYDVWNCVIKEKLIVKQGYDFPIMAWTLIVLKSR